MGAQENQQIQNTTARRSQAGAHDVQACRTPKLSGGPQASEPGTGKTPTLWAVRSSAELGGPARALVSRPGATTTPSASGNGLRHRSSRFLSPDARTPLITICITTVRQDEEVRGDGEAEGLGGLEIDDQLEVHRLLDGQVGGLGTFQDSVHVVGATLERIRQLRPIGHEAPLSGK